MTNLILNTDSYKLSHYKQYPPGTEYVSSYIEARGSDEGYADCLFFGLQAFIIENLRTPITAGDVEVAEQISLEHGLPFNREGWDTIVKDCGGYLPLEIYAVPEGSVIPLSNVLVQVENADPRFPWLTSYIETAMLRAIWYPTTVATNSYRIKKHIAHYLKLTATNPEAELPFKLHDFGARGVSSQESALLGGMAHLVNFQGTDTIDGLVGARRFYNEPMAGFSIPASEHSTVTSWGREHEPEALANMIDQFLAPGKIAAFVSDSYDIFNMIDNVIGGTHKEKIINSGGTLVVRPDSGDPVAVPVECVERLMNKFGYTVNEKGFKVLPDCVRVIQGDGIDHYDIVAILGNLYSKGISAENIAFGCGGGLLQKVNRDTLKFAMKANAIYHDGGWHDVYKEPVHQKGKKSKRGRLALVKDTDGKFQTIAKERALAHEMTDYLELVYARGDLKRYQPFSDVRKRASEGIF